MDVIQDICRTVNSQGHPVAVYICPDAMTERRTRVPKEYKDGERHGKEQNFLTNRIMGVDVTCGPNIDTKMLFHLDGFVGSGANLMVEVLRQVIVEVGKLLAKDGHSLPTTMYWQMDNCGENKNKGSFYIYFQISFIQN
jgi:diacylglycerol kinase family enzyme